MRPIDHGGGARVSHSLGYRCEPAARTAAKLSERSCPMRRERPLWIDPKRISAAGCSYLCDLWAVVQAADN